MTDTTWGTLINTSNPSFSHDYTNAANWDLLGIGAAVNADDTGIFGTSNITEAFIATVIQPGGCVFNPGASSYTFDISPSGGIQFFGSGITINGGSVTVNNHSAIDFFNNSTAGSSLLNNTGSGKFTGLTFHDGSNAGRATIVNMSQLTFTDDSSAGNAFIYNSSTTSFTLHSTAGNATIRTLAHGLTTFADTTTAGNARLTTLAGGTVDFSASSGPNGNHRLTVGSIAGEGTYDLGGDRLVIGSNRLSTTVNGRIDDGGDGGSLVKVGNGALTLSGAQNSYSGGTTLRQGIVHLLSFGAAGSGTITFAGLAELKIANGALSPGRVFDNVIHGFGNDDIIDLTGLPFGPNSAATFDLASHHLKVHSNGSHDTLTLVGADGVHFTALSDGHGGTEVMLLHA
jgi:autotransporter-associated beta strand protein